MKSGRKIWLLAAAVAVIIVVVVLVVLLTSSSGPSGTPTPTPTYTAPLGPTATRTVGPNQTDTCNIYFNTSSFTIGKGETVALMVVIDNVDYIASGQFDVLYDKNILNVAADPSDGTINDTLASRYCGNVALDIDKGGLTEEGAGANWWDSGRLRILVDCPWSQTDPGADSCSGGNGTGPCGDGYLTILTFKGMNTGTCEIAFREKLQVNQIVDWGIYQDYPYPCNPNPPISTPMPCVPDSVLTWGPSVQVTVQ